MRAWWSLNQPSVSSSDALALVAPLRPTTSLCIEQPPLVSFPAGASLPWYSIIWNPPYIKSKDVAHVETEEKVATEDQSGSGEYKRGSGMLIKIKIGPTCGACGALGTAVSLQHRPLWRPGLLLCYCCLSLGTAKQLAPDSSRHALESCFLRLNVRWTTGIGLRRLLKHGREFWRSWSWRQNKVGCKTVKRQ